tara:strand:- start:320 stop:739 length:420 start_codon:yes stop_codon:yes gene_type:complete
MNLKRRGSQYEAAFATQALKRGLDILEPYGDYMPYDVMVQNGDGRILRVQVKGTGNQIKNKPGYKVIAATGNSTKTPINPDEVDVLAAYVEPEDTWYVIPVKKLKGNVSVYLNPNTKRNGRYEVWKEAWNVFQNGGIPG